MGRSGGSRIVVVVAMVVCVWAVHTMSFSCPRDPLSCVVFNSTTSTNSLCVGNNVTVPKLADCVNNVCFRCVVAQNKTQFSFSDQGCSACPNQTQWFDVTSSVCSYFVGSKQSMLCSVVQTTAPAKNTTVPAQLSDGAVAGILVGLLVATAVGVTLYCMFLNRQQSRPQRV